MHKRDCGLDFFPPFLSLQLIGFAILRLLEVRYRFRVQIFVNTLLSIQRRKQRRNTLAKFGIFSNLSSTNIRLLVFRERFYPTFLPFFALLSYFIDDFYDFFASDFCIDVWYRHFTVIVYLVERLFTRKRIQVSTLFIEAEYIKYE